MHLRWCDDEQICLKSHWFYKELDSNHMCKYYVLGYWFRQRGEEIDFALLIFQEWLPWKLPFEIMDLNTSQCKEIYNYVFYKKKDHIILALSQTKLNLTDASSSFAAENLKNTI